LLDKMYLCGFLYFFSFQSFSAGKQASRQAGKQAGRQAGKQASRQAGTQPTSQTASRFILQNCD